MLPIQALESEADTLARRQRVTQALAQYKKQAGLEVDPEAEAAARAAYERGVELMRGVRVLLQCRSLRAHNAKLPVHALWRCGFTVGFISLQCACLCGAKSCISGSQNADGTFFRARRLKATALPLVHAGAAVGGDRAL